MRFSYHLFREIRNVEFRILDITGKVLISLTEEFTSGNHLQKISTENYSSGIYFVKIKTETGFVCKQFVKF
ncbi:MAG: T9SS type A sorting domain-containing protein [Bacteroidales bacterium]|nr:T9SS type A sorting domain-containing protein [Bacteroidales bacterium]